MQSTAIQKAFGILGIIWLLSSLLGCASVAPSPTSAPLPTPAIKPTPLIPLEVTDFVMPNISPTESAATPFSYPATFDKLDFGGNIEESSALIQMQLEAQGMDMQNIIAFYLAKLWQQGVISGDSFDEVAARYGDKLALDCATTTAQASTCLPRLDGSMYYAVDENGLVYPQLFPLGETLDSDFTLVAVDAASHRIVPSKDGYSFSLVEVDGEGTPVSWLNRVGEQVEVSVAPAVPLTEDMTKVLAYHEGAYVVEDG